MELVRGGYSNSRVGTFVSGGLIAAGGAAVSEIGRQAGRAVGEAAGEFGRSIGKSIRSNLESEQETQVQPPAKKSATEAPSTVESASSNMPSDNGDNMSTSVTAVTVCPPPYIAAAYQPPPITLQYRKKNRFYIDASNYKNVTDRDWTNGNSGPLMHCMPWKSSAMYMNNNEAVELQMLSKAYRYKECGFRIANVTTHTGDITGSGDPHINLSYNGVLCFAGTTSRHDVGPTYICNDQGQIVRHHDVERVFSAPRRDMMYQKFDFNIGAIATASTIKNNHLDPTGQVNLKAPNFMERMYTQSSAFPVTEFKQSLPDRWRMSTGSYAPVAWRNSSQVSSGTDYMDGQGYVAVGTQVLTGGHKRNLRYETGPSDGELPYYDNFCVQPNRQSSIFGFNDAQNIDDLTLMKMSVDDFLFGFMVPVPTNQEPHIYLAFEIESFLTVEYLPYTYPNPLDPRTTFMNLGDPAPSLTWEPMDKNPNLVSKYVGATEKQNALNVWGTCDPVLVDVPINAQIYDSNFIHVNPGLYGPNMRDGVTSFSSIGNGITIHDSGWDHHW